MENQATQESITRYVLGEFNTYEQAAFGDMLGKDALLKYEAKELSAVAELSKDAFVPRDSSLFALNENQREKIREESGSLRLLRPSEMVAGRSESSVLFSLGNLKGLAAEPSSPPEAPVASRETLERHSGLVDIRHLAGEFASRGSVRIDDDPFGNLGVAVAGPLTMPETWVEERASKRKIFALVGITAVLVVAAALSVFFALETREAKQEAKQAQIAALMSRLDAVKITEPAAAVEAETRTDTSVSAPDENEAVETDGPLAEVETKTPDKGNGKGNRRPRPPKNPEKKPVVSEKTPDPTPEKKPASTTSDLDQLLAGPGSSLPAKLTREEVKSGMNAIKPLAARCGSGQSGTVTVRATISASGRVTQAVATGSYAGTPTGTCVSNAVRRAKFARTQSSTKVKYPFPI